MRKTTVDRVLCEKVFRRILSETVGAGDAAVEREVFARLIDWDTDAQTLRQLVRACHRNAAAAVGSSAAESSVAADAEAVEPVIADGIGSAPVTSEGQHSAGAVSKTVPAQQVAAPKVHGEVVADGINSSSSIPDGTDGSQDASAAATRPADIPAGDAAQPANKRRKAHSAAQRQLLDILRPLAQRALSEAQLPADVESAEEAGVFA